MPFSLISTKRKLIAGLIVLGVCCALFVASGFFIAWQDSRKELQANRLPDEAYRAIESDSALALISLHPERIQLTAYESGFHGYRTLGETVVSAPALRRQLANTLRTGVQGWRFTHSSCFSPRHGIHAVLSGRVYEFVICFECGELIYYPPDAPAGSVHGLGQGAVAGPFTEILRSANVKLAD